MSTRKKEREQRMAGERHKREQREKLESALIHAAIARSKSGYTSMVQEMAKLGYEPKADGGWATIIPAKASMAAPNETWAVNKTKGPKAHEYAFPAGDRRRVPALKQFLRKKRTEV
jgi:hypothetical protein